eukprot:TRINITY_DN16934_c0_g1_i3.p1 TRINITY_DN16934_c0_g1~~TRINITY_DN16934_c0_g1_i3.p1  ORF type:complete len:548 (+),score=100.46 TRINITY_DN16934_c0_g1_i3:118-1761(+)
MAGAAGAGRGAKDGRVQVLMEIPPHRARILAKAIACIMRVNDELFFEPGPEGCVLRVVNAARTAHFHATLAPSFFTRFEFNTVGPPLDPAEQVNLRLSCKHFHAPFRHGARLVQSMTMELRPGEDQLIVQVELQQPGLSKEYRLNFKEEDSDKADCQRGVGCSFRCRALQLTEIVQHFHGGKTECIRFLPTPMRFNVSSPDDTGNDTLSTMLSIATGDFTEYKVTQAEMDDGGAPRAKEFEIKYLRCFVSFCEACGYEIDTHFNAGEAPVLFEARGVDSDSAQPTFTAAMLVAAWEPERPAAQGGGAGSSASTPAAQPRAVSIQSCHTERPPPVPSQHAPPRTTAMALETPHGQVPPMTPAQPLCAAPAEVPVPPEQRGLQGMLAHNNQPPAAAPPEVAQPPVPAPGGSGGGAQQPFSDRSIAGSSGGQTLAPPTPPEAVARRGQWQPAAGGGGMPPDAKRPRPGQDGAGPIQTGARVMPSPTFSLTPEGRGAGGAAAAAGFDDWNPAPYDSQVQISPAPGPTPHPSGQGRLFLEEDYFEPSPSPER